MSSLKARLAKAKARLLGTAARDVPVPFELPCGCGHRVAGIRRSTFQVAVCSACQAAIYVLPVNVYPATRRVRSEVVDGPVAARVGTIVRDLVAGESSASTEEGVAEIRSVARTDVSAEATLEASEGRRGNRRRKSKSKRAEADSHGVAPEPVIEQPETGTPLVLLPRVSFAVRLKKLFSPTRLLALAGVGILVLTGWWMVRQRQMDEAQKVWRREMDLVQKALKDHDLTVLQSALKKAVDAATVLNRPDDETREAESLLRQTDAVLRISSADLVTMLSGVTRNDGSFDVAKAAEVADALTGQHLVFEAPLGIKSGRNQIPELDMPLIVNGVPLRIAVPSRLFLKYAQANPSVPLLFVAAIRNCQPPADSSGEWRISLDAVSCTLITTEFHAKEVGFDLKTTPRLQQTLERQAEFVKSAAVTQDDAAIDSEQETKR